MTVCCQGGLSCHSVIVTYDSGTKIIKVVGKKVKSDPVKIAVCYGNSKSELASTSITVGDTRAKVTEATFKKNIPTISGTSGIKLDRVLDKSGVKTDDGNPVIFNF